MVFSSLLFLFRFLPIVLILYFIAPKKYRNAVLFFSSLFFYAWGEPIYVCLMLFSTVVDYTHGRLVHYFLEKDKRKYAACAVASSMVINLLLLGFFKYADFFILNVNHLFGLQIKALNLALPIGISFYTFQTMSYTIDIFRGQAKVQRNIISFGAYVALFPQLIAGPIVQYKTISEELAERKETLHNVSDGICRFVIGLGKKVLLANNIGLLWEQIRDMAMDERTILMAWIGIVAYAFQIYFDFSAYSDMAIGLGRMFGFHFPENFNYPYMSKSITEFWRRWHISLGSWFREYVYIPLGGNKRGLAIQIRNIVIVWLLTGIWHGASWNFVIWGVYFGILLIIEKAFLLRVLNKCPAIISHIYTMFLVLISWVIFAIEDIGAAFLYLQNMFGFTKVSFHSTETMYQLVTYGFMLMILCIASTDFPRKVGLKLRAGYEESLSRQKQPVLYPVLTTLFFLGLMVLSVAYLVDASYNPFLYFRF